jgi:diguanylate cyclase (GGDEF)-like protein
MDLYHNYLRRLYGTDIPVRIRYFNLMSHSTAWICIFVVLMCLILKGNSMCLVTAACSAVFAFAMSYCAQHFRSSFKVITAFTEIILSFFSVPMLFITAGGIHGGFMAGVALAFAYTLFILPGALGITLTVIEAFYYAGMIWFAYFYPGYVSTWGSPSYYIWSVALCNAVISVIVGFSVKFMISMYQHELDSINEISKKHDELALLDPLTGLYVREYAESYLNSEIKKAWEEKIPLSVMFIDISNLNEINRKSGFHTADDVIIRVSEVLREQFGPDTVIARYSGKRFLVVCPSTAGFALSAVPDRLTERLHAHVPGAKELPEITLRTAVGNYVPGMTYEKFLSDAVSKLGSEAVS